MKPTNLEMEATLKASNLKSKLIYHVHTVVWISYLTDFTKSLNCLSKYGDVLTFQAMHDGLALSCTNSSKSAYARFTFAKAYWKKWNITRRPKFTFSTQPLTEEVKGEVIIKVCFD
jgi:hypothetical protein